MYSYRVFIAILLLVLIYAGTAQAYSSRMMAHQSDIRTLALCVEVYEIDNGHFPVSDSETTWYEKLIEADPAIDGMFKTTSDGKYPIGYYGDPIIFETPSPSSGNQIVIRDVGRNGIDDLGLLDDWDSRYGPNSGYWYKANWPAAYRRAWVCVALALAGLLIIAIKIKQVMARFVFVSLWLGLLAGVVLPFGFVSPLGRSNGFTYPQDLYYVVSTGFLILHLGIILLVLHFFSTIYYRRSLRMSGAIPCEKCAYDLRGTIAANIGNCPECGESVPADADRDVDLT